MSTAARKNRKHFRRTHNALVNAVVAIDPEHADAASLVPPFQHPDKGEATPVPLRGISSRAKLKRMAALIEVGRGEALTAHLTPVGDISPDDFDSFRGYAETIDGAAPTPPPATPIELDPKPFLCGKSRFANRARAEGSKAAADGSTPRFAPREGYSQAIADYLVN